MKPRHIQLYEEAKNIKKKSELIGKMNEGSDMKECTFEPNMEKKKFARSKSAIKETQISLL